MFVVEPASRQGWLGNDSGVDRSPSKSFSGAFWLGGAEIYKNDVVAWVLWQGKLSQLQGNLKLLNSLPALSTKSYMQRSGDLRKINHHTRKSGSRYFFELRLRRVSNYRQERTH